MGHCLFLCSSRIKMSALRRLQTLLCHAHRASPCLSLRPNSETSARLFSSRLGPALHVSPKSGLADDDMLDIRASGLLPGQLVTLRAEVESECRRFKFQSEAWFQADRQGNVSVRDHASLGGTYEGVEPNGLIWSCKPAPEHAHRYPRLKKADSRRPINYTIELTERGKDQNAVLASEVVERRYLADYVKRLEVSSGKAYSVVFLPEKRGESDPLPVVVELRGLGNGVLEDRGSLTASHGYAVIEMDFMASFEVIDNKKDAYYFNTQAFLDLFEYIRQHPRMDESRVGIFGFCTGSQLALHGITRLNLPIRCVVFSSMIEVLSSVVGLKMPDGRCIDPLTTLDQFTTTYKKDGFTWFCCKDYDEMMETFKLGDHLDSLPPLENMFVPSLFILADDDQYQPSKRRMEEMVEMMKQAGKGHLVETLDIEGAGHLLDAPGMPICTQSSVFFPTEPHPYFTTWGGTPREYAHSVKKAWDHVLAYFKHHLKPFVAYR